MAVAVLVDFVRDVAHGSRAFDGMIGFGTCLSCFDSKVEEDIRSKR